MADLQISTIMLSIQAIQKQIEYFEGLLDSETVTDKPEIQELLLGYDQAADELKAAYIAKRSDGSNFPEYEDLVNQ